MSTMNSTIEYIDRLKPNVYSEEDKYAWIIRVEGMISTQVHEIEPVIHLNPEDADKELSVPAPFDDIYALYVAAMIDFYNKEYSHYNNSAMMFTERLEQYKAWYIRHNMPKGAKNFRNVMG